MAWYTFLRRGRTTAPAVASGVFGGHEQVSVVDGDGDGDVVGERGGRGVLDGEVEAGEGRVLDADSDGAGDEGDDEQGDHGGEDG